MTRDRIIQTKLSEREAAEVATAASARGLTIAAYLRQSALLAARPPIMAWAYDYVAPIVDVLAQRPRPHYVLHRVGEGSNGELTCLMFTLTVHDQIVPVSAAAAGQGLDPMKFNRKEFILDGSMMPWLVVRTTARVSDVGDIVEIVLRPEGSLPTDAVRRRVRDSRDAELFYELTSGKRVTGRVTINAVGVESCDLRLTEDSAPTGKTMTLPYASVVGVGFV